jgi:hypothetical protein
VDALGEISIETVSPELLMEDPPRVGGVTSVRLVNGLAAGVKVTSSSVMVVTPVGKGGPRSELSVTLVSPAWLGVEEARLASNPTASKSNRFFMGSPRKSTKRRADKPKRARTAGKYRNS